MMLIALLLVIWPLTELLVAIGVAHLIGVLDTVLLLLVSVPVGSWAMGSQGRAAWQRLREAVAAGRQPGREVLDGALVLLGGAAMIVPGFISDVVGALLLLPPSRRLVRGLLVHNLRSRVAARTAGPARSPRSYDVDSTATDVEPPRLTP